MKRPIALTITTLIFVLRSVYGLLFGLFLLQPKYIGGTTDMGWLMLCTALMLESAILILVGIGLWRRRNWARWSAVVISLCGLATNVILIILAGYIPSLFHVSLRALTIDIANNAFDLWVVVYLLRFPVRSFFSPMPAANLGVN
jgi:hypothetical protein